jgi:ERCC4-type nuclease
VSGGKGGGGLEEAESERDVKATAQDMLLSLPCINATNYRAVMDKVESVAALSRMSEAALSPLIGPSGAKKLFQFFRQRQF